MNEMRAALAELNPELHPSPFRRSVAVAMTGGLGVLLIWLAMAKPPSSLPLQLLLLGLGVGAILIGQRLWASTSRHLILNETGLVDSDGRIICPRDSIKAVERGAFAFKPSNGFLLRLNQPVTRGWAPGLWWRFGRRVGVGGVTPASQGKFMADVIALDLKTPKDDD